MSELEEFKKENNNLRQQLNVAMQKLAVYESDDLEKVGYFALKSLINQQVEIIREFKLKDEITKNPKDDKFYDRVKAIGEGLRGMISDLKTLRGELKISTADELKNEAKQTIRGITPESIADSVGELAGMKK